MQIYKSFLKLLLQELLKSLPVNNEFVIEAEMIDLISCYLAKIVKMYYVSKMPTNCIKHWFIKRTNLKTGTVIKLNIRPINSH